MEQIEKVNRNGGVEKSPHILNTSSNLLGLCFIVLTSLKVLKLSATSIIDECTTVAIIMFFASCFLSYFSMRSRKNDIVEKLEKIADIFFFFGLLFLFITAMLVAFNIID